MNIFKCIPLGLVLLSTAVRAEPFQQSIKLHFNSPTIATRIYWKYICFSTSDWFDIQHCNTTKHVYNHGPKKWHLSTAIHKSVFDDSCSPLLQTQSLANESGSLVISATVTTQQTEVLGKKIELVVVSDCHTAWSPDSI